jgi:hypothetical protein
MTDLALAAMEADIEAIAKLETWRAKMQLDHDSKEYLKMKKALLKSSSARLTKGQGARSKAKAKKEKLQWPTKSERTSAIKADDWDKAMAAFQKRVHGHWASDRASPNSFAEKGNPARRFIVSGSANGTLTYVRIVQVEPKKWRCDVATVKEAEEAGEEEERHIDQGTEPVDNGSGDDDDDDKDDEEEEEEEEEEEPAEEAAAEEGSEDSWGVPPPKAG